MIRVLVFFAVLFLVAIGFAWMADLPGVISIGWQGYVWEQPPVIVALVVGVLLAAFLAAVWLVLTILRSPKIATRFFSRRRKDKGYQALSHGLIALGTGNVKLARRYGLDAEKLLKGEPAARLLLAQTAQLAGRNDEARGRFEAMLDDPDTRALGLHGLFIEAERQKEPIAARHYAEEAFRSVPGLEWAGQAVLGYQAIAGHWDQALTTLERNFTAKLIDKKTYRRHRAVILTALAEALENQDPERAYSLAKEAHGLALELVPAAVIAARFATRRGDIRQASKLIESTWRLSPHPDLAEAYAHARIGDSAVDRLKRAKGLANQRANTSEGALAVARAAMEAREFGEARDQLKKVLRSEPTRGAFLLMAELEEAEHGDRGRMRDWLSRAVRAPLDKAWVADGVVSNEWQAVSPVTGQLDAFVWATPNSLPALSNGEVIEDSLFEAPAIAAKPVEPAAVVSEKADPIAREAATDAELVEDPAAPRETLTEAAATAGKPAAPTAPTKAAKVGFEGTTDDIHHSPPMQNLPDAPPGVPVDDSGATPATQVAADKGSDPAKKATKPVDGGTSGDLQSGPKSAGTGPDTAPAEKADTSSGKPAPAGASAAPKGAQAGQARAEDKTVTGGDDLTQPIAFPFSRMPDDPGPDEDEDAPKEVRPKFFN